jgi:CelD/BcsL family acetyltransferase involved in cellulose biosynthesis
MYDEKMVEGSISIELVESDQGFKNLRREWKDLLERSLTNTIFLTWEWLYSWWNVYASGKKLNILCVRNENNELVGIAPFFIHEANYYKIPVVEIAFLGDRVSDRQDLIVDKRYPQVYKEIVAHMYDDRRWHTARLEQVPEWSTLVSASFRKQFDEVYGREEASLLPFIYINSDWETYYKGLSKNFRRDLSKKYNILTREGKWRFINTTNLSNIDEEFEKIFELELASDKAAAGYALFVNDKSRHFHKTFSKYCVDNDWLSISYMELNDRPISYLIGYRYENSFFAYNMAYLSKFYRASPGKLVLHETIKHCFLNNFREFDLLRGDTYIKDLWTKTKKINYRIVFFNKGLRSRMLKTAIFGVRPIVKRFLFGVTSRHVVKKKTSIREIS